MRETAAVVCTHLAGCGHKPTIVGRSCAAIYGGMSIKPDIIEFVVENYERDEIKSAMKKIGFKAVDRSKFENKKSRFGVILLPGPLTVGDDLVSKIAVLKTKFGLLNSLTATDCVRHRLSMYYRCGDMEAFEDALKITRNKKIDLHSVARWSEWEWSTDKFSEFTKALGEKD